MSIGDLCKEFHKRTPIVACRSAHAKHPLVALPSDLVGSRARTQHRDVITVGNRGGRKCSRARISSEDRHNVSPVCKLLDCETGHLRLRGVVLIYQLQLLAEHALNVDLVERHLVTVLLSLAKAGLRAGER